MTETLIAAAIIFAAISLVAVLLKRPRLDRDWAFALTRQPTFAAHEGGGFLLKDARAFEYGPDGAIRKEWFDAAIEPETLVEAWFFIEPFPMVPVFAHSFLSFAFEDADGARATYSISIEARKETGKSYSPLAGVFRAYELCYVWSTEKDVASRIAVKLKHRLFAYRLDIPREQAIALFRHFAKRTNDLAAAPRFYSTLFSNCTNELAKAVNEIYPRAIAWHRSWIVTGRSAEFLHRLGFLGDRLTPFRDLRARSQADALIRDASPLPVEEFSAKWREAMVADEAGR